VRDWWTRGRAVGFAAVLLLLGLAAFADQPASVLAGALAAAVVALLAGGAHLPIARSARIRAASLRQRARRAGVPPLRDPDTPGRARPRAPSA
jgi:Family of unknown function (DUF6412)